MQDVYCLFSIAIANQAERGCEKIRIRAIF
jgi:hypothetical protein